LVFYRFSSGAACIGFQVVGKGLNRIACVLRYRCDVKCFHLGIVQLPPLLVLGFVIAYVFSVAATTPAVIFTIYALFVSTSDMFLKPLLLGRGLDTPMLVILLGAIGGMLLDGVIGLFVGAVVLALGYELFMAWLTAGEAPEQES